MIAAIETSYAAMDGSSSVARSGYLNWNFNTPDLFHKVIIYEKLSHAVAMRPDVIQVGDSSGFHAIVPSIVDRYLGGLKYANLSCCANTGFTGYYTIAEYVLDKVSTVKAVVLYVTLYNFPRDPRQVLTSFVGGQDRLPMAFGWIAPFITPPTLAARESVVRPVYTLDGSLDEPAALPVETSPSFGDLARFIRATDGWWPEHDTHLSKSRQDQREPSICALGDAWPDDGVYYTPDIFGRPQSFTRLDLSRLADLTARHGAKLIVLIQPNPCPHVEGSFLEARRKDVAAVAAKYENVVVADPALFEPWPWRNFISSDHLRTGFEEAASSRVGRAVAAALGLSMVPVEQRTEPNEPSSGPVAAWSGAEFGGTAWRKENVTLRATPDGTGTIATETSGPGWHRIEITVPQLPAGTYVASVVFRAHGERQVQLELRAMDPKAAYGFVRCDGAAGESWRSIRMLDSGIEELPDGSFRCWGKLDLPESGGVFTLDLIRNGTSPGPYDGNGRGAVEYIRAELSRVPRQAYLPNQ
ncbi:MAG: hypothetical protein JOY64_37655 [Alphaproteobacteria bacterium]|nr:hypothetical protein [Alphaproteobacteria bacterium]MBV8413398.1 hypothetical protein [Alphaproteobacteria bacterium]